MSIVQKPLYLEIINDALQELSDIEYQRRVWIKGSESEMSSMDEAVAALFNDSCLDIAIEKNAVVFSPEIDRELRELRKLLQSSLYAQQIHGTAKVIKSSEWKDVRNRAARILEEIKGLQVKGVKPGDAIPNS